MRKLVMILIIVLTATYFLVGCSDDKVLTFEEGKSYYQAHKAMLQKYGEEFYGQNSFVIITRLKKLGGMSYSFQSTFEQSVQDQHISIQIPRKISDEEEFWKQDFSKIYARYSSEEKSLGNFLDNNNIDRKELLYWARILRQNSLYGLMKTIDFPVVKIHLTAYSGLIYNPSGEKLTDFYADYDLQKLDDNWYFFEITEWL